MTTHSIQANVWFVVPLDYMLSVNNNNSVCGVWDLYVTGRVTVYGPPLQPGGRAWALFPNKSQADH